MRRCSSLKAYLRQARPDRRVGEVALVVQDDQPPARSQRSFQPHEEQAQIVRLEIVEYLGGDDQIERPARRTAGSSAGRSVNIAARAGPAARLPKRGGRRVQSQKGKASRCQHARRLADCPWRRAPHARSSIVRLEASNRDPP